MDFKDFNIILGSQSPRRKTLLEGLDIHFSVKTIDNLKETFPEHLTGGEIPLYLSKLKARAFLPSLQKNDMLITADTIVWQNDSILGKPKNLEEAKIMLQNLSENTHEVFTGVSITTLQKQVSFTSCTKVTFASLSDDEINYYVERYRPTDKAGSYGIQEWIGYIGVERIEGSYFNVMGLPVQQLYKTLKNW